MHFPQMGQLPTPADVARRYLDILKNTPRVAGDRRTDKLIRRADKAVARLERRNQPAPHRFRQIQNELVRIWTGQTIYTRKVANYVWVMTAVAGLGLVELVAFFIWLLR